MELKFSFGGASPDHHDHGDAPSGIPLPFTTVAPGSTSGALEVRVRRTGSGVVAEVVTGDEVVYCASEVAVQGEGSAALARAVRSAASRAVATLEGPLAESVTALVLDLDGAEAETLGELGIAVSGAVTPPAAIDDALQRRIGIASGIPIRFGS